MNERNECSPDESRPKTPEEVIYFDTHKDKNEIYDSSGKESYLVALFFHASLFLYSRYHALLIVILQMMMWPYSSF